LPEFIEKRNRNFEYLRNKLCGETYFIDLPLATENSTPSWFGFPITLKKGIDRVNFTQYLDEHKIGTRLLFAGNLTKQPYFQGVEYIVSGNLNNTDIAMNQTLWLGIYPGISLEMLDYVADTIILFLEDV